MSYQITVPYAPGTVLWCCAAQTDEQYSPCPDCGGGLKIIVLTNQGMYALPCETCNRGWEGPRGWVMSRSHRRVPRAVVLGQPTMSPFDKGAVEYETEGGGRIAVKDLYETEEACLAACVKQDVEHHEYLERQNWNKGKYGRTEAARHVGWHRAQLKQAERDVAYHASRIKELTPKGGA